MQGQVAEQTPQADYEILEGNLLLWGHRVLGVALVALASDVTHPDAVVVTFGVCPLHAEWSPHLDGAIHLDDKVVSDISPIIAVNVPSAHSFDVKKWVGLGVRTVQNYAP